MTGEPPPGHTMSSFTSKQKNGILPPSPRQVHHQPAGPAGGGAVSPRQDRVRRRRGGQKRHEAAGLRKSHREESAFRGGCSALVTGAASAVGESDWNFQSLHAFFRFLHFRPKLVLTNPVRSWTCCGIPWSSASASCPRTTRASAASWKS